MLFFEFMSCQKRDRGRLIGHFISCIFWIYMQKFKKQVGEYSKDIEINFVGEKYFGKYFEEILNLICGYVIGRNILY